MARYLLTSMGVLAVSIGTAHAQENAAAEGGLEEIVVTAQRRAESMQSVPLAITVMDSAALERKGVVQVSQLGSLAPGLSIGQANGAVSQLWVRGVGTNSANAYSDNAVAFNVDGVVFARNTALEGQLFDVSRIEVLKGPQGTLYGRNATGGAVNVITNRPSLDGFSGNASLEIGDYDLVRGSGAVNVPLSDKFAVRVAGQVNRRDGYMSDGYDDAESESARIRALYEPTDGVSLLFGADYSSMGGNGSGSVLRPFVNSSDPWTGPSTAAAQAGFAALGIASNLTLPQNDGYVDMNNVGVSAELNWETDAGTLTALAANRHSYGQYQNYATGFRNTISENANQQSLEVRFATDPDRPVSAIVGAFLFQEDRYQNNVVNQSTASASRTFINELPTDAYAAFGQASWSVTDELRLTAGVRYTKEEKSLEGTTTNLISGVVRTLDNDLEFDNTSWKVGVEYDLTPDSLLYASASTGFKAGGFYTGVAPDNTFAPEKLTAFAIGSKNVFLDDRLRLNLEAFYWDYQDHQESHLGFNTLGQVVFKTENVGQATIQGVEAELGLRVGHGGNFRTSLQYLDAVYDEFSYIGLGSPISGCAVTNLGGGPPARLLINCDGKTAARSPEWSGNVGYEHRIDLGSAGSLTGAVDMEFATSQYLSIDYTEAGRQASYQLFDLSLSWTPVSERYSITGWVRNVGDEAVAYASGQGFDARINMVYLRPPRTFGLRLSANF